MAFDLLASAKTTALAALVSASFASPMIVKSDIVGGAGSKHGGSARAEVVVAGGVAFAMPGDWGRLGATSAADGIDEGGARSGGSEIGVVVTALCPGGSTGAACKGDSRLTFVSYSGAKGHELPRLTELERQFDAQLARSYAGFAKTEARQRPGADDTRFLDYSFTWRANGVVRHERFAAFRHDDGSGVIAMANGLKVQERTAAIDAFLASAHEPTDDEA